MAGQLALDQQWTTAARPMRPAASSHQPLLCAACCAREARYGFRDDDSDPTVERPRTLCFECFRAEVGRRQAVAARLARGWDGVQVRLPLEKTLESLGRRRRHAQIAARRALQS